MGEIALKRYPIFAVNARERRKHNFFRWGYEIFDPIFDSLWNHGDLHFNVKKNRKNNAREWMAILLKQVHLQPIGRLNKLETHGGQEYLEKYSEDKKHLVNVKNSPFLKFHSSGGDLKCVSEYGLLSKDLCITQLFKKAFGNKLIQEICEECEAL